MNLASFRVVYPEFRTASDELVSALLAEAATKLSPEYWTTYYDQAHGLLTAHKLSLAPNGQMARLQSTKAESTYGKQYQALLEEITFADRIA